LKVLFLGDVFGRPGRRAVESFLSGFSKNNQIDLCIANCENLSSGKGISEKAITEMVSAGVHIFSSGNHLWDKRESMEYIARETRIAKPLNYPKAAAGFDKVLFRAGNTDVMLLTLCGQAFMNSIDSPFHVLDNFLDSFSDLPKCIIVDFHAESTAEKKTFGYYFDGRVSAIVGTHTHIQTADEEILEKGTAYITDVGMCGAHNSIIGIKKEIAFDRVRTGTPVKHEIAEEGILINAVYFEIDEATGKALSIERIRK